MDSLALAAVVLTQQMPTKLGSHLIAALQEIDRCNDLEQLRALSKQILIAQETKMTSVRGAQTLPRAETTASSESHFSHLDWLDGL